MKNSVASITKIIATSQDGKNLDPEDRFSAFILGLIDYNVLHGQEMNDPSIQAVDIDDLKSDIGYMIQELSRAKAALDNERFDDTLPASNVITQWICHENR